MVRWYAEATPTRLIIDKAVGIVKGLVDGVFLKKLTGKTNLRPIEVITQIKLW